MFLIRGNIMFLIRGSNKLSEAYQRLIRAKMFLIRILIRGLSEDGITKINVVIEHPALVPANTAPDSYLWIPIGLVKKIRLRWADYILFYP